MNFLRGSTESWESQNPILEDGQPGFERVITKDEYGNIIEGSDYYKLKIGDGITPWNKLPYIGGDDSGNGEIYTLSYDEETNEIVLTDSNGNDQRISIVFDDEPTLYSMNPVTSDGIYRSFQSLITDIESGFTELNNNDKSIEDKIDNLSTNMEECCSKTHTKLDEIKDLILGLDNDGFQEFLEACAEELNKKGYPVSNPTKDEVYNALLTIAYAPIITLNISDSFSINQKVIFNDKVSETYIPDNYIVEINVGEDISINNKLSFIDSYTNSEFVGGDE